MNPRRRVAGFPSRRPDDDIADRAAAAAEATTAASESVAEGVTRMTSSGDAATAPDSAAAVADAAKQSDVDARAKPERRRPKPKAGRSTAPPREEDVSQPGGFRHQTNFRLYESEMSYLRRLKREFEDDEVKTDITELVHALVYTARRGELDTLEILRRWRRDLNEF